MKFIQTNYAVLGTNFNLRSNANTVSAVNQNNAHFNTINFTIRFQISKSGSSEDYDKK
ncbi:MAG: hypothetical protein WBG48_17780 [Pricia sp.]